MKFTMVKLLIFCGIFFQIATAATSCTPRDFGKSSFVCVCDESSCDTVAPVEPVGENQAVVYLSDKAQHRLDRTVVQMRTLQNGDKQNVTLHTSQQYQKIQGFGGAFTDAAGINIASLPNAAQLFLLKSYYSPDGIEYNLGRVPISSADFSTRKYSYDDVSGDFKLDNFALVDEDFQYKIPYIKQAQSLSARPVKLFGSSWSAPAWMKTSGTMEGNGTLLGQPVPGDAYYTTWANYYIRFLQEYAKNNLTFFGLTGQNEPTTGFLYDYSWQTQGFTAEMQRDFIKNHLGPALEQNNFKDVGIMILDDQRLMLPSWAQVVLADPDVKKYVSHIAVHWYMDEFTPTDTLDLTHKAFPDVPMLATEACWATAGAPHAREQKVILGSWERAEGYCHDIIEDLNHWFTGWVDWNLALDLEGGPNWAKNFVDAPIIVNATSKEFFKQPMFYALGHFSKFLQPGSYRVGADADLGNAKIELTTFTNTDGYKTVVAMNKDEIATTLTLGEDGSDKVVDVDMPPRSIATILWK